VVRSIHAYFYRYEDIAPSTPVLIAPDDNAEDVQPNVVFVWSKSVDKNDDFNGYNLYINSQLVKTFSNRYDTSYATTLLNDQFYTWKVEAIDKKGNKSVSEDRSFRTRQKDQKYLFGQLSTLNMTPESTGLLLLKLRDAKGLKRINLNIQYTDLISHLALVEENGSVQSRFSFEMGTFEIEFESSITTDEVTTVAAFVVEASEHEGTTELMILPSSTFTHDDGSLFMYNTSPGQVNVKRKRKGLVSLDAEQSSIMMGESIGLDLAFTDTEPCVEAVIKISKDQPVSEYQLTNWNFVNGTRCATEIRDDMIVITINASDTETFNLPALHELRVLPNMPDENYTFALDSVIVKTIDGKLLSADCYGIVNVYCHNQSLVCGLPDEVNQGDSFFATETLVGETKLDNLQFDLNYDSNLFEIESYEIVNKDLSFIATQTDSGIVKFSLDSTDGNYIEAGDVFVFKFKAVKSGNGFVQTANIKARYCVDGKSDVLLETFGIIETEGKEILVFSADPVFRMEDVETTLGATYTVRLNISAIQDLKRFDIFLDFNPVYSSDPIVRFSDRLAAFHTIVNVEEDWDGNELRITGAATSGVNLSGIDIICIEFTAANTGVGYVMFDPKTVLKDSNGNVIDVDVDDTCRILIQ